MQLSFPPNIRKLSKYAIITPEASARSFQRATFAYADIVSTGNSLDPWSVTRNPTKGCSHLLLQGCCHPGRTSDVVIVMCDVKFDVSSIPVKRLEIGSDLLRESLKPHHDDEHFDKLKKCSILEGADEVQKRRSASDRVRILGRSTC